MILLWSLQILLDIAVVAILVKYFVAYLRPRPLSQLRAEFDLHKSRLDTPLGAALSTISEKRVGDSVGLTPSQALFRHQSQGAGGFSDERGIERMSKAKTLLNQGHGLAQVARETGLSMAELSLMEKTMTKNSSDAKI